MGKKITYVATRADPTTEWYHQTPAASADFDWVKRMHFMKLENGITTEVTTTSTTLTSIVTIQDNSVYDDFISLTQEVQPQVAEYCTTNNITYNVVVEDI